MTTATVSDLLARIQALIREDEDFKLQISRGMTAQNKKIKAEEIQDEANSIRNELEKRHTAYRVVADIERHAKFIVAQTSTVLN